VAEAEGVALNQLTDVHWPTIFLTSGAPTAWLVTIDEKALS
jgi:hypothetical protein